MGASDRVTTRLESWKAVASYFGRDERTVRRWEAERGLPIHRLPGGNRSRIYAEVAELEAWRSGDGPDAAGAPAPAQSPRHAGRRRGVGILVVGGVALAALLAFGVFSLTGRAGSFAHAPPPEAQRLYAEGSEAWEKRTPGSLNQALDDFNGALRIDPNYAEAYVGLAKTFNLLRQYTLMPDSQAYPLARQAAEHALELNERLPEAHAALAFADYWGFWDETAARREFERAIALDPDSATSHHWYATFLNSTGDFDASLREIRRAQALDPNSMSIRADSGFLLAQAGQPAAGIATLKAVEATDPGFVSPHTYLRNIYFNLGPDQAYLQEDAFLADSTHDPAQQSEVVAARQGYATGGRRGMLQALLSVRLERARVGAASAYSVARLYGLLDEKPLALSWLQRAIAKRETDLTSLRGDLAFQNMRKDPVFEAVAGEFKPA